MYIYQFYDCCCDTLYDWQNIFSICICKSHIEIERKVI